MNPSKLMESSSSTRQSFWKVNCHLFHSRPCGVYTSAPTELSFFRDYCKIQNSINGKRWFCCSVVCKPAWSCFSLLQFRCRERLKVVLWLPTWCFSGLLMGTCSRSFNRKESSAGAGWGCKEVRCWNRYQHLALFPAFCVGKTNEQKGWATLSGRHGETSFPAKSQMSWK